MNIDKIVDVIASGGLVIAPTGTIYGILGDATDTYVINKVYNAKKRDTSKPLLILVSSIDMLKRYVEELTPLEEAIIEKFWPGELTIILRRNEFLPFELTHNETVGVMMPNSEEMIEIIRRLDKPIIGTSANISNQNSIISVDMIDEDMKKYIDYIEDSGIVESSPSTIIKVEDEKIVYLRKGKLTKELENFELIYEE